MANDWASVVVSVWPYLVGAGVLVSAAAAVLTLRSPRRRELRQMVLNPIYDFAVALKSHEPEEALVGAPWGAIRPSDWDRLKGRKRTACEDFRDTASQFASTHSKYALHVMNLVDAGLHREFDERLGPTYVDPNDHIPGSRVGLPPNYRVISQTFFRQVYPHLLRHLDHRDIAWQEVVDSPLARNFDIDQVVAFLRKNDPPTLDRLYDLCTTHVQAKEGMDVVRELDEKHIALMRQAERVRRLLRP